MPCLKLLSRCSYSMCSCGVTSFTPSLCPLFSPACERPCRLLEQAVIQPTDTVSGLTLTLRRSTWPEGLVVVYTQRGRKCWFLLQTHGEMHSQHRRTQEHVDEHTLAHTRKHMNITAMYIVHSPSNNNLIPLGISVSCLPTDVIGLQLTQMQTK